MISLVIPVYRNSANIPHLLAAISELNLKLSRQLEAIFVVDGSPDDSYLLLDRALPSADFRSKLLLLSRNFGALSAIHAGLAAGTGEHFAVMAADLQEPPELIIEFVNRMTHGGADVVVGKRVSRNDPFFSRMLSATFWWLYRRLVQPEVPEGGVDTFGCRRDVRDQIVHLSEQNSSLIGLLFWIGFRRQEVSYGRRAREIGTSAWTLKKKVRYLSDSIFSFTDLPIRLLTAIGLIGLLIAVVFGAAVIFARLSGLIDVPGYAATVVLVIFFGALNCFGLGVVGGYVWRAFENSKGRPNYIVAAHQVYSGSQSYSDPRLVESVDKHTT